MPRLTADQKKALAEKLKTMDSEERADMIDALGLKDSGDLASTVELLQKEVAELKKGKTPKKDDKPAWLKFIMGEE